MLTLMRVAALSIPLAVAGCSATDMGLQPLFGPADAPKKVAAKKVAATPAKPATAIPKPVVKPLSLLEPPACDMANLKLGCKDLATGHIVKVDAATMVKMLPPSDPQSY